MVFEIISSCLDSAECDPLTAEQLALRIPREEDRHIELDRLTLGGRQVEPVFFIGGCDVRLLENALRTDDDVLQVEVNIGERGEQFLIELCRALFAVPAGSRVEDGVNTILGQRCHQAEDVAGILGGGMRDPQPPDGAVIFRVRLEADLFDNCRAGPAFFRVCFCFHPDQPFINTVLPVNDIDDMFPQTSLRVDVPPVEHRRSVLPAMEWG